MTHDYTRRRFLVAGGSLLALTLPEPGRAMFMAQPTSQSDLFQEGVASGDPLPNAVLLWTRLTAGPNDAWVKERVKVDWEVATDDKISKVVARGSTFATPELHHTVHIDARGLSPSQWYFYRFRAGSQVSPVGRTKTAPATNAVNAQLNFAFASCQHYEHGYFTPYQHMVREDIDLVVHLGDYIYEYEGIPDRVRRHTGQEITSLRNYRDRYSLYRSDADLREAHRLFPWIVTWDDHEVDNNYAGAVPEDKQGRTEFLERRANAYQAYYECMPLRRSSMPQGSRMQLYRDFRFGKLAHFAILDTRQYRTDQPCGDGTKPACEATFDESSTLMGPRQEEWLKQSLMSSGAAWNVLANQVMMTKVDRAPGTDETFSMDQWGGYEAARVRMMRLFAANRFANPVVITGDIHTNWVGDLKEDFRNTSSPIVGTEFVGTAITSGGDGAPTVDRVAAVLPENPQIRFFNSQRGYVRCSITPKLWRTEFRVVEKVSVPKSPIETVARFVVESGKPGAQRA